MEPQPLGYNDFCEILGRAHLRFEIYSRKCEQQIASLNKQVDEMRATIEVLQANLEMVRKDS